MSQKNDKDETSFEGLMSFSTAPPPAGDVHNARTVMAELPDDVLASLKAGNRIDGSLGAEPAPQSESMMTRRARPFELEKAIAAAVTRGSVSDAAAPEPLPAEAAAAISFSVPPPVFPPTVEIASSLLTADEPSVAPTPKADQPVPTPPSEKARPRRSFVRAAGVVAVCVAAAIAAMLSIPFLRQRLHLD